MHIFYSSRPGLVRITNPFARTQTCKHNVTFPRHRFPLFRSNFRIGTFPDIKKAAPESRINFLRLTLCPVRRRKVPRRYRPGFRIYSRLFTRVISGHVCMLARVSSEGADEHLPHVLEVEVEVVFVVPCRKSRCCWYCIVWLECNFQCPRTS